MKESTNKEIEVTLQDVLEVTQKGFERIDKRFEEIEEKMVTKDELHSALESTEERIISKVNGLAGRIDVLEDTSRVIKTKIGI